MMGSLIETTLSLKWRKWAIRVVRLLEWKFGELIILETKWLSLTLIG